MKTAWMSLALLGLAGCASSMDRAQQSQPEPQSVMALVTLPQHQMAELSATQNRVDVPLKPMTASQSAARMN